MKKFEYLKKKIMTMAKSAMSYDEIDQEVRLKLAHAYLGFLPVVSLAEQYDDIVKTVFLTAYGDKNIPDLNRFCVYNLQGIYNDYEDSISKEYKFAVNRFNAVLDVCETKGYHGATDWSDAFAEDLYEYLPWKYLVTGEVRADLSSIYDVDNFEDIVEYAKKQGFYPSRDK